jgi:hypothetical protein
MGIGDSIRDAITPNFVKKINTGLTPPTPAPANPSPAPVAPKTPQQAAYEAKEKAMNANNPSYVPRAKGGCVKKGGAVWNNQPVKKV